jgi:hypothetical protein
MEQKEEKREGKKGQFDKKRESKLTGRKEKRRERDQVDLKHKMEGKKKPAIPYSYSLPDWIVVTWALRAKIAKNAKNGIQLRDEKTFIIRSVGIIRSKNKFDKPY